MHFYHEHVSMYDGCKDRVRRAHSQLARASSPFSSSAVAIPDFGSFILIIRIVIGDPRPRSWEVHRPLRPCQRFPLGRLG